MSPSGDVVAIVVLYRPKSQVSRNLSATLEQCARVVVVQNSPEIELGELARRPTVTMLDFQGNTGTAGGFNRGIMYALASGAEPFVLLLDQDSRLAPGTVAKLVEAHRRGAGAGRPIGAVGAALADVKTVTAGAAAPSDDGVGATLRPVESLASSGTLISRQTLHAVGLMDQQLFIDAVDHEWCLRARDRGFGVYQLPSAVLHHDMGDRAFSWCGRARPIHDAPVRHYYIIRNSILLLRRPYLSVSWRWRELLLTLRRLIGYAILSRHRRQSIRYMLLGVRHGLLGVGGRLDA